MGLVDRIYGILLRYESTAADIDRPRAGKMQGGDDEYLRINLEIWRERIDGEEQAA